MVNVPLSGFGVCKTLQLGAVLLSCRIPKTEDRESLDHFVLDL